MKSFLSNEVKEHFTRRSKEYLQVYKKKLPNIKIPDRKRVLEAGCGGRVVFASASNKYAVDITPVLLKEMRHQNRDVNLLIGDVRFLPFRSEVFYVVAAISLLHHLVGGNISTSKSNIELCLTELKRVSEEKGYIYVSEDLAKNRLISLLFFYVTLICAKLDLNLGYFDIHDKVITHYLDEKSFKKLIHNLGLRAETLSNLPWTFRKINFGQSKEFILHKHD